MQRMAGRLSRRWKTDHRVESRGVGNSMVSLVKHRLTWEKLERGKIAP